VRCRFLLLPVLVLAGLIGAQDIPVEATGYGANLDAATRSANRAAIEKGIGTVLTSQTEVENFQVKKDLVITHTEGAVKSSEVIKQTQGPDGAWEVTVRAVVSKSELRDDLMAMSILRSAVGNPRVAILVRETVLGKPVLDGPVEHQVILGFRSRGFEVVDPSDALRIKRSNEIQLAEGGDPKAAAAVGAEWDAEVVIVGNRRRHRSGHLPKPLLPQHGDEIRGGERHPEGHRRGYPRNPGFRHRQRPMINVNADVAASQALEKAAKKAMDQNGIIDQLVSAWQDKANNGLLLRVRVEGIPNYLASQTVVEELRTDAVSVETRKLADRTLFLDVSWRGTASDFCAAMDGRKINKDRNKLVVASMEGNSIVLEVK
jgi:hypothetical protein